MNILILLILSILLTFLNSDRKDVLKNKEGKSIQTDPPPRNGGQW